jgi:hypothetical protein
MKTLLQELYQPFVKINETYLMSDSEFKLPSYMVNDYDNHLMFKKYCNMGSRIIKDISEDPEIVVKYFEKDGYILCLDYGIERIAYSNRFNIENLKKSEIHKSVDYDTKLHLDIGKCIMISGLYRNTKARYTYGLPEDIYLNYLVPKFNTVISDGAQSIKGSQFWKRLAGMAFNKNYNVYLLNITKYLEVPPDDANELEKYLDNLKRKPIPYKSSDAIQFSNVAEIESFAPMIWKSNHDRNINYGLAISNKDLFKR